MQHLQLCPKPFGKGAVIAAFRAAAAKNLSGNMKYKEFLDFFERLKNHDHILSDPTLAIAGQYVYFCTSKELLPKP